VTPLFIACQQGHESTVLLLLDRGAKINLADNDGVTPFFIACQQGPESTVLLLLDKGAKINVAENDGTTPLCIASQQGHESTARLLLDNGASINLTTNDGATPLLVACRAGHATLARILLERGATIDHAMKDGVTALHLAAFNGHLAVAKMLAKAGATLDLQTENGHTASAVRSKGHGQDRVADWLKKRATKLTKRVVKGVELICIVCFMGDNREKDRRVRPCSVCLEPGFFFCSTVCYKMRCKCGGSPPPLVISSKAQTAAYSSSPAQGQNIERLASGRRRRVARWGGRSEATKRVASFFACCQA